MARRICNHPVFPKLRAKLITAKVNVCPTCLLRLHVFEIAEVQSLIERRGGIFISQATAVAEQEKYNNRERDIHKGLVKRWRLVRIALHQDLLFLENLRTVGANKARWEVQLDKAFEFWNEVETECNRIPGYRCSDEGNCVVNEGKSDIQQDVDFEYKLNEDTNDELSDEDLKGWQTVETKERSSKKCPRDQEASLAFSLDPLGATDVEDTSRLGRSLAVQRPDVTTSKGVDDVPSKVARGSYWDGRNRFDLLREIATDQNLDTVERTKDSTPLLPSRSQVGLYLNPSTTESLPATSSLKRKRLSTSSFTSRSSKKVHQADCVTVICDAFAHGTTGLPPEQNSYTRPHSSYTTAERARRRREFFRPSPIYVPSTWALSDEYENINTSHFKTSWANYEVEQRLDDLKEDKVLRHRLGVSDR